MSLSQEVLESMGLPKDTKKIRILIEIPTDWVDLESPMGFLPQVLRQEVHRILKDAIVDEYVKKVKIPAFTISDDELKEAIKDRMVEKAIQHVRGGDDDE